MIGRRFSQWMVIGEAPRQFASRRWRCRCACGTEADVVEYRLVHGQSTRCVGCRNRKNGVLNTSRTEVSRDDPTWRVWRGMWRRCVEKTREDYTRYGALGVRVAERWADYKAFLADIGPRPSLRHTLDRFPVHDGNYEPGNCRWATWREQEQNRGNNIELTLDGETLCVSEWARRRGLTHSALRSRLANGWSLRKALSEPLRKKRRNGGAKSQNAATA